MVYGEIGRFPLVIDIKIRITSFWIWLKNSKQSKMPAVLYKLCRKLYDRYNDNSFIWLQYVKKLFGETGFSYVWENEINFDIQNLKCTLKQRLQEQYIQNWYATLFESSKAINYRIF